MKKVLKSSRRTVAALALDPAGKSSALTLGEKWIVDGQWELVVDKVEASEERDEYSKFEAAQVVYVHYRYRNLGYEDPDEILDGLLISPDSLQDEKGELAQKYAIPSDLPYEAKVGETVEAKLPFALANKSQKVSINFRLTDKDEKEQAASFVCPIE